MALKKKVLSSLLHTTDHGVPTTGTLAMGRGPFGSGLTTVDNTESGSGASMAMDGASCKGGPAGGRSGGRGRLGSGGCDGKCLAPLSVSMLFSAL